MKTNFFAKALVAAALPEVRHDQERFQRDTRSLILSDAPPPLANNFERRPLPPLTSTLLGYIIRNSGGLTAAELKALKSKHSEMCLQKKELLKFGRDVARREFLSDHSKLQNGSLSPTAIVPEAERVSRTLKAHGYAMQILRRLGGEDALQCAKIFDRLAKETPRLAAELEKQERELSSGMDYEPSTFLRALQHAHYSLASRAAVFRVRAGEGWAGNPGALILEAANNSK